MMSAKSRVPDSPKSGNVAKTGFAIFLWCTSSQKTHTTSSAGRFDQIYNFYTFHHWKWGEGGSFRGFGKTLLVSEKSRQKCSFHFRKTVGSKISDPIDKLFLTKKTTNAIQGGIQAGMARVTRPSKQPDKAHGQNWEFPRYQLRAALALAHMRAGPDLRADKLPREHTVVYSV